MRRPPCERLADDDPQQCPKYKLWPGHQGLNPKNLLAVQLYSLASRDQRVGMEGVLIGTLSAADALAVLELYAEHLPTPLVRQRTFELMILLDRVVTEKRGETEKRLREAAYQSAKGAPRRKK